MMGPLLTSPSSLAFAISSPSAWVPLPSFTSCLLLEVGNLKLLGPWQTSLRRIVGEFLRHKVRTRATGGDRSINRHGNCSMRFNLSVFVNGRFVRFEAFRGFLQMLPRRINRIVAHLSLELHEQPVRVTNLG